MTRGGCGNSKSWFAGMLEQSEELLLELVKGSFSSCVGCMAPQYYALLYEEDWRILIK